MMVPSVVTKESLFDQSILEVQQIASNHRENFSRWMWFFSKQTKQDLQILYAFCRYADHLADEDRPNDERLRRLIDFEENFIKAREKQPSPTFLLRVVELIDRRNLPEIEFLNLLSAFKQDQVVRDWQRFDELLAYSKNSANPVGRLVLGIVQPSLLTDPFLQASDDICTGLQLVNFWQDVSRDFENQRIYLPRELREKFSVTEEQIEHRVVTDSYRSLIKELCQQTELKFQAGRKIFRNVPGVIGFFVDWFATSGLQLLRQIEKQQYDTLSHRPTISKLNRIKAAAQSFLRI